VTSAGRTLDRALASAPFHEQVDGLESALAQSVPVQRILADAVKLDLPGWYLGASAVSQTVWNQLHGFAPAEAIKDYDLVYFDASDLSVEAERATEKQIAELFADLHITLDVKNEARVHLWYADRYGRTIDAYACAEDAIATWPTTASSVGVRYDDGRFVVCAPFGLHDVFAMVARPNKAIVSQAVYEEKVQRWAARWPQLTVVPW
jgi:hypothetical protein